MATTSLGIPKYAQTDNADIASKLNAIADQSNTLLVARSTPIALRRVVRTDGAAFAVASGGTDRPVTSYNSTTHTAGLLTYGSGVITLGTGAAGLYLLSTHTSWPASSAASGAIYSRLLGWYVNGARTTNLLGCDQRTVSANEGGKHINLTAILPLVDGDGVQVFLSQTGPASEDVHVYDFTVARIF